MLNAIDKNSNKVRPTKGEKAICPFCREKVIAVCGDINIHHWRHENISNCDTWKESETEWHRMWKEKFPKKWQEYIIEKNGEKHIADIKTDAGLVLELQNSSISNQTIQIRENFYQNMVWLINAENFKDNFHIGSLVTENLKKIDNRYKPYLNRDFNVDEHLKDLNKTLSELKNDLNFAIHEYDVIQKKILDYKNKLDSIESIASELLSEKYHFFSSINIFKSEYVQNINEYTAKLNDLDKQINDRISKINEINNFPNSKIRDYEDYKIVPFERISSKNFQLCKVVKTDTISLLFQDIIQIKSESHYNSYSSQKNEFTLLVDLSKHIEKLTIEIEVLKKEMLEFKLLKENDYDKLLNEIKEKLISLRDEKIIESKQMEKLLKKMESDLEHMNIVILKKKEKLIEDDKTMKIKLRKDKNEERYIAMKSFEGKYSYSWSHRRKSWDYAECPIFLDFNKHIFEITSENEMRKISIEEFINNIKNWR